MLPAILFDLNRERCDQIAMQIVATTEKLVLPENKQEIERITSRFRNSETGYLIQNALRALEHGVGIHHEWKSRKKRVKIVFSHCDPLHRFDTVGNVVLCGNFTLSRIQSLVLAQPEPLRGLPSLTPSFLLQLLKLSKYGLHAPLRALQYENSINVLIFLGILCMHIPKK
jgi:hypothetical protein